MAADEDMGLRGGTEVANWYQFLLPTLFGWLLGLIGTAVYDAFKQSQKQKAVGRVIRAEIEVLFKRVVEDLHFMEEMEDVALAWQPAEWSYRPPRSIYHNSVSYLQALPGRVLIDVVRFYQLLDRVDVTRELRNSAGPTGYAFLYFGETKALRELRDIGRRVIRQLADLEGISGAEEELNRLEREAIEEADKVIKLYRSEE